MKYKNMLDCGKVPAKKSTALIASAMLMAASADMHAQPSGAREVRHIDEIIVVAQRREESLQKVPVSVTAISSDQLKVGSINSGLDLQKMVPTLHIQQAAPNSEPGVGFALRGIRTGVLSYLNEVPVSTSAIDSQMFDLESVQALAGPQGTLFGRNSTGGAILFVPKKPTDEFEGDIQAKLGNFNLRETAASINIPISDVLAVRAATRIVKRDGIVENISGHDMQAQDRQGYRISALFEPTDTITNYTVLDYSDRAETAYAGILELNPNSFLPAVYPTIRQLAEKQEQLGKYKVDNSLPEYVDAVDRGISNILTIDFDFFSLKYILSYRDMDTDQANNRINISLPIVWSQGETFTRSKINEIQFFGDGFNERLEWLAGIYHEDYERDSSLYFHLLRPAGTPLTRDAAAQRSGGLNEDTYKAAYSQMSWRFTDNLKVTLGGRYTKDSKESHSIALVNNVCGTPPEFVNPGTYCTRTLSDDYSAVTYMASVDYEVSDDILVYATTRKGFKSGDFNNNVLDERLTVVDPEYLTDYELGIKSNWLIGDVPVRMNLSTFYGKYEDIIRGSQRVVQTPTGPQTFSGTFNAAEATIYGGQVEVLAQITDQLTVSGFYGYLNTEYDSFDNPLTGDLSGNKFSQAPQDTLSANVNYRYPLSNGSVVANASYSYVSEYTYDDANITKENSFADGYGLIDVYLGVQDISMGGDNNHIDIGFFAKNVTDKEYPIALLDQTSNFGFVATTYGDPRTYGLQVRYSF